MALGKNGGRFRPLGGRPRGLGEPPSKPRGVKTNLPRTPSYLKVKEEVEQQIELLPYEKRVTIPPAGTLPERMVALVLCWLNYQFQAQRPEDGGRLRIGGAVVDFLVFFGAMRIVLRVQGDYWHSLPSRRHADVVQAERLRAKGLRVADLWERDLYQKWVEGNLKQFVDDTVRNAA